MSKKSSSKRSFLIDVFLLTAIFSTFLVVIFLTFFNTPKEAVVAEKEKPFTMPESQTSEMDSPFQNIKIVADVSNDEYSPFALQYPLTTYDHINEQINDFIKEEKNNYIQNMRLKKQAVEADGTGELNISFEISPYNEQYYSFLIKSITSLPKKKTTESYKSFFFNNEDGNLINFNGLLANNEENLKTFSSQIYKHIKKDKKYGYLKEEEIVGSDFESWSNFETFIIQEEKIHIFFNDLVEPETNIPTSVALTLSSINALLDEKFQIEMAEPTEQPVNGNNDSRKLVALTFDDGPHPDVTPQILNLLDKYNAKATFFMLGSRVQYYPEIAKNVYDRGHEVGNHTWNHPILTKLTEAQILKEYSTTEQAIIQAIGAPSTVFRPPYGATNKVVKNTIESLQVNWTIDTEDWKDRSAEKLLPSVKNFIHDNSIILMHDIHQSTADGLEGVLKFLQDSGYEFVTVSELMKHKQ